MGSTSRHLVIVRSVRDQHLTVAQAATRYGVCRQWVYTLLARYDTHGVDGLTPRSKAPHTTPGALPQALVDQIISLRHHLTAEGADAGALTIAWHLEHTGYRVPSDSTIRRVLHRAGLITPAPGKRPKSTYTRFQADAPNECWQADITHWHLAAGTRVEILDFLDDHSRYLLHLRTQPAFTGADVVTAMQELITTYGPPASTLTDNGLVFTARLARHKGGRNGFEKLLQAHHIHQKNGAPGHPQTQGKIERFHQTLKRWLTARPLPATTTELQDLLDRFRTWYNTARPHRALARATPATAYTATPKATPTTPTTTEWRTRTDVIDPWGKISLRYAGKLRHLGVGRAHIGEPVLMLIHDNHVITSNATTGQIIAEHTINPTTNYQRPHPRT